MYTENCTYILSRNGHKVEITLKVEIPAKRVIFLISLNFQTHLDPLVQKTVLELYVIMLILRDFNFVGFFKFVSISGYV